MRKGKIGEDRVRRGIDRETTPQQDKSPSSGSGRRCEGVLPLKDEVVGSFELLCGDPGGFVEVVPEYLVLSVALVDALSEDGGDGVVGVSWDVVSEGSRRGARKGGGLVVWAKLGCVEGWVNGEVQG